MSETAGEYYSKPHEHRHPADATDVWAHDASLIEHAAIPQHHIPNNDYYGNIDPHMGTWPAAAMNDIEETVPEKERGKFELWIDRHNHKLELIRTINGLIAVGVGTLVFLRVFGII